MANPIRLVSWNVRGLYNKFERSLVFQYLGQSEMHVVLQETRLDGNGVLALCRPWIQSAFHATFSPIC